MSFTAPIGSFDIPPGIQTDYNREPLPKLPPATRDNPCPVCGRDHYCLVAEDRQSAICTKIHDGHTALWPVGDAGTYHRLIGFSHAGNGQSLQASARPKKKHEVPEWWAADRAE